MGCFSMPKGIPNKRYTPEFKIMVVETMRRERLSCKEAARQFEIPSDTTIALWERIYLSEGSEGLSVERRGRAGAANGVMKGRPVKLTKRVEDDLIAENQRLRAENAYLKKLQALVLEDERKARKKRW